MAIASISIEEVSSVWISFLDVVETALEVLAIHCGVLVASAIMFVNNCNRLSLNINSSLDEAVLLAVRGQSTWSISWNHLESAISCLLPVSAWAVGSYGSAFRVGGALSQAVHVASTGSLGDLEVSSVHLSICLSAGSLSVTSEQGVQGVSTVSADNLIGVDSAVLWLSSLATSGVAGRADSAMVVALMSEEEVSGTLVGSHYPSQAVLNLSQAVVAWFVTSAESFIGDLSV